jgi:putative ubiquitin-RnfH superfamily antitoxin RatB of RatAB toxin-antitoxin module
MQVTVVFSPAPRTWRECVLQLPAGASLGDAVAASGLVSGLEGLEAGIWGRKAPPQQPLREGDRVELYRPLRVDPKVARRERFRSQGARAAGLFARRGAPKPRG